MKNKLKPAEMLTFKRGDIVATIATNGTRHVIQEGHICQEFLKLTKAIAYLEATGYKIATDQFKSF